MTKSLSTEQLSSKLKESGSKSVNPEKVQQDCKDFQLDSEKINPGEYAANLIKHKRKNEK